MGWVKAALWDGLAVLGVCSSLRIHSFASVPGQGEVGHNALGDELTGAGLWL